MKVIRSPGVQDTHIHAVLLILDPARLNRNIAAAKKNSPDHYQNGASHVKGPPALGSLDQDMDLQVLRTLHGKTTVIPVIAKADTITTKHMSVLKRTVWDSIKKASLDPLEALGLDEDPGSKSDHIDEGGEDDDETASKNGADKACRSSSTPGSDRLLSPLMRRRKAQESVKDEEKPILPFSIISPDLYEPGVIGRRFPWGCADPYNERHCDFQRLKEAIFTEWRGDLREASRDQWYEDWRTNRLKQGNLAYRQR